MATDCLFGVVLTVSFWQMIRSCVVLQNPWQATPLESYHDGLIKLGPNTTTIERLSLGTCAQCCLDMNCTMFLFERPLGRCVLTVKETRVCPSTGREWSFREIILFEICKHESDCSAVQSAELGMQSGAIPSSSISVSAEHVSNTLGKNTSRLMAKGGWSSPYRPGLTSHHYWITLTLPRMAVIRQIATQGCSFCVARWVREFSLRYSPNNVMWQNYTENDQTRIFTGNTNNNAVVYNDIDPPIVTRYLMLFTENITKVNVSGTMTPVLGLRMEIYGCWN